ncbi:hypothetical protein BY996DRAFT_8547417 [Phakopsora pachyrhizi]|nr:hypothetical protein BY996DRAFT_8547417 [Phakopsora pachyrhizi]
MIFTPNRVARLLISIPLFNRLNTTLDKVHKTGLGSSSAMVTSLCSAILIHLTPLLAGRLYSTRQIVHNLAQYVHLLAQGKVGSRFDVSAAVWGSHKYRCFSEKCLNALLSIDGSQVCAYTELITCLL